MSTSLDTRPGKSQGPPPQPSSMHGTQLPTWFASSVVGVAALVAIALALLTDLGWFRPLLIGWLITFAIPIVSRFTENSRKAMDRLITLSVYSAFAIALIPLGSILWAVISRGAPAISVEFLTYSMRNVVGEGGGIYHAIVGSVLITAWATAISVPIGIFTAIYIVEYGGGNRLSSAIRFLVDVMTGIPSIVAGLFAYALFVIFFGPGVRMGIGGSVALSVLMVPIVVRSTEEMLKLVPNELREASYALGVPKWRTIAKVVLPTAIAGIATGITLAIARVVGETAPLLVIVGLTDSVNFNMFDGRMATLPVFAYYQLTQPDAIDRAASIERAWGAALVLLIIVMLLNTIARLISYFFSPKGEK